MEIFEVKRAIESELIGAGFLKKRKYNGYEFSKPLNRYGYYAADVVACEASGVFAFSLLLIDAKNNEAEDEIAGVSFKFRGLSPDELRAKISAIAEKIREA